MSQYPPSMYPPQPGGPVQPHRGPMILTFGILGIVCCLVFAILAWVFGSTDLKKMERGEMDRSGEGLTRAGMICGIVGTILQCLGIIIQIILLASGKGMYRP